jgi:peptide/nickel transport system permease protein
LTDAVIQHYLFRRLLHALFLLAGISVLSFVLLGIAPGDFLGEARISPQMGPQTLAALSEQYGLNKSLLQKYLYWLGSVAKGDLGVSFAYNLPVSALLWPRAWKTLQLTTTALALSWLIAVPLGVWSAANRSGILDRAVSALISLLIAIPDLVLACAALFVAVRIGWFRAGNAALPVTVLVLGAVPVLLRHVRGAILSVVDQAFVRAARAHGIGGARLWFVWLLPAAAHPLISLFGLSVAGLISSSLLVEAVLGWPGLGPLFLEAISARDFYLVIDPVMLSAMFLMAGTLLSDALLYTLDPRIRV